MTAATTITDAELVETLSLITTKMDSVRHRIAADGQLTVSEAAELAIAIEEITADTYLLADRLGAARSRRGRPRVHAGLIRRKQQAADEHWGTSPAKLTYGRSKCGQ